MAPDRVISTVDPAMRHGRKTTATKVDGYQSHQLTQSVPPATGARLITAVVVTPANTADGSALPDLVTERAALTGTAPAQVLGDTAYGPPPVQAAVTAVAPTTHVVAPVPPANHRAGLFPKTAFTVDPAAQTVTCPAGATVAYGAVRPRTADGRRVVRWAATTCTACPVRAQCVPGSRPRSLAIRSDEPAVQAARAEQATAAWQAHYRQRRHVEHVQAQQTRHGGRTARYWGPRKVLGQERLGAVLYTVMELARVAALPPPSPAPRADCA